MELQQSEPRVGARPLGVVNQHHRRARPGRLEVPATQPEAVDGGEGDVLVTQAHVPWIALDTPALGAGQRLGKQEGSEGVPRQQRDGGQSRDDDQSGAQRPMSASLRAYGLIARNWHPSSGRE